MNTRNRRGRYGGPTPSHGPYGLGTAQGRLPGQDAHRDHGETAGVSHRQRSGHPLTDHAANERLARFERLVRGRFDAVVPTLKAIGTLAATDDLAERAASKARAELGVTLPAELFESAWITGLDMRRLYAVTMAETIHAVAAETHAFVGTESDTMTGFLLECGFHAVDISPCSDGRLKGVIRSILRLPDDAVRSRKAYAGAMFDVEANVRRWIETELLRFREGSPVPPSAGTRYLKIAVYHWSRSDPDHEGCAAHGSNQRAAAAAALSRLRELREAVENSFFCGASIDLLLIGVDTDTDAIRVHVPDALGDMDLDRYVDNLDLYRQTIDDDVTTARMRVHRAIEAASADHPGGPPHEGMRRLIATLLINNLSQIDYVRSTWGERYPDVGHAEAFISVGDGFEEFQVRNLAYFVFLQTVEEAATDLDVGIGLFQRRPERRGLPIPIAIHFRYDRRVPGSRERAIERCVRVRSAIRARYRDLCAAGLLACDMSIQERTFSSPIEVIEAPSDGPANEDPLRLEQRAGREGGRR